MISVINRRNLRDRQLRTNQIINAKVYIFTEEQINKISISQIIRDGDIGWLASSILPEIELDVLLKNQKVIEKELGNLTLRELADDTKIAKIEDLLKPLISKPQEVAKAIVEEAKFWESKLKIT